MPTIGEAGLPGFENVTWYGLIGPKGSIPRSPSASTPPCARRRRTLPLREKLAGIGTSVRSETLEQFRATVKADRAKWAEIVKASGAKID